MERAPLRLELLGGFRVVRDGEVIPDGAWVRPSARALVKLLAVQAAHRLHRDEVMEHLWPDLSPESATQSFRNALSWARKALAADPSAGKRILSLTNEILQLDSVLVEVDVDHFQRLAGEALREGTIEHMERASAAYRGELLPEDRFEDWSVARRDELVALHHRLEAVLVDALESHGRYGEAIARAEDVLRSEPALEEMHRRLIRLHFLSGSRYQALKQYRMCRRLLEEEIGVEPDEETEALHREILAMAPSASLVRSASPLPSALARATISTFVGRATSLETLLERVEELQTGTGSVALISGEPGIGKSRLVAQVAVKAATAGIRVLRGAGYGREGAVPYAPFIDALDECLAAQPRDTRAGLAKRYSSIARLIPSLSADAGETPTPGRASPQFFANVIRLLADLAEDRPLLLILDDLHAVDAASVQLFEHLMRAVSRYPWLVLGTFRMEDVDPHSRFAEVWSDAVRTGLCRRIGLMRMNRAESEALIRAHLPGAPVDEVVLDHVIERSAGNPLFIGEVVASLQQSAAIELSNGRWTLMRQGEVSVPLGVRDLISNRVATMSGDVQHLLRCAAVAGGTVSYAVLRDAMGASDSTVLDALDDALERRFLQEQGEGYAFTHPLYQEALYAGLRGRRLMHLHGLLAAAFYREQPDDVEVLAHHYMLAGSEDLAIGYQEAAGDRATSVFANQAAEKHYRQVITWLDAQGRATDAARVRAKLADTLQTTTHFADALDVLVPALRTWRALGDTERVADTAGRMGTLLRGLGRMDEGFALLEPLSTEVEQLPASIGAARYYLASAQLKRVSLQPEPAFRAARRAASIAGTVGDDVLRGQTLVLESLTERTLCSTVPHDDTTSPRVSVRHSIELMQQALELYERLEDLRGVSLAASNLGTFAMWAGEFERAASYYGRLVEVADRTGDVAFSAWSMASYAWALSKMGKVGEGIEILQVAVSISRNVAGSTNAVYAPLYLGAVLLSMGRWAEAETALDEAETCVENFPDLANRRYIAAYRAQIELEQGRPEAALQILTTFLLRVGESEEDAEELLPTLARAYAEVGNWDQAECLTNAGIAVTEREECPLLLVEYYLTQAKILLGRGNVAAANGVLDRLRAMSSAMPYPFVEGQALLVQGSAPGIETRIAVPLLQRALELFQRIQAAQYVARTESILASRRTE